MTSGGTNFHIWHNSKLAKIKATDGKSSSSSISMLQSAMNQQAETFQSLWYESKTEICVITRSCSRPGGTDLDVELSCKLQFLTRGKETEGPPLADSQPFRSKNLSFRWEIASLEPANSLFCHIWKLVPPDVMHVISFTRLPLFSRATLKRSGSLGTRLP